MTQRPPPPPGAPHAIHASAVAIGEAGVLIRGASGAGKSALALALVEAGAAAGLFARLVGDDRLLVNHAHGRVLARPHPAIAGRVEKRGEGIHHMAHEPAVVLRCVVDLVENGPAGSDTPPRLPMQAEQSTVVETVTLARLVLPASAGAPEGARRALAFLREAAR
ncbi:MAG: aldolase [Hyphomicrobiales bacterium]|nr:aldolase [Hyphomicrobiales bacterium]